MKPLRQAIRFIIRSLHDLLFILKLANGGHRAKSLFLHNSHVGRHIREDSRLDVVPARGGSGVSSIAEVKRCTLLFACLDVLGDLVVLHPAVLGSLVNIRVEVVADLEARHALGVGSYEFCRRYLVGLISCAGVAGLAEVHFDAPGGAVDCFCDVGVLENDVLGHVRPELEEVGVYLLAPCRRVQE